ncbi:Metallo-dependent phosphatase-like [Phytophthora cactorum]|nr:Metallo-dependent phosphatase-like [Phytophthora cactorum]
MELEAKEEASATTLCGLSAGSAAADVDGYVYHGDNELFPDNAVASESAQGRQQTSTKVVFLTVNDVYELFPDANAVGGLAELATMLKSIKKRIAHDTHVIVTLNGDFLWRSELDRKDKGCVTRFNILTKLRRRLTAVLLQISYGRDAEQYRHRYPGLIDTHIVPLSNGFHLGMFGVVTTVTGKDPFAGSSVVFDDERPHAQRCVEHLKAQGANVIVALTHFKVADDIRLAMQVPGINLILGGHDHFPVTCAAGVDTLIHKSGMDALWLGAVEMTLITPTALPHGVDQVTNVQVGFQWQMLLNRGYQADPACLAILNKYIRELEQEELAQGKLEPLGTALTALDGRRLTCRTQESNMGNLVADALREGLGADVGLVNAGYIKGDMLNDPGLVITRKWLEKYLPLMKPTVVVELSLRELKNALTYWLRRYPAMSSSQPHFSGIRVIYDATQATQPVISSIRLSKENYEAGCEDAADTRGEYDEAEMDRLVTVGMPLVSSLDGWHFFGSARQLRSGPLVRDFVEKFVRQRAEIDYPPKEGRLRVIEPVSPQPRDRKVSAL